MMRSGQEIRVCGQPAGPMGSFSFFKKEKIFVNLEFGTQRVMKASFWQQPSVSFQSRLHVCTVPLLTSVVAAKLDGVVE